jgi:cell division ATPase FtsA
VEGDEDTVLVALARNSWLSPRLEAARSAGLRADGGCPCSVALFNAFLAHGNWEESETTFLVSIGRENIDMAIQQDGELLFSRNISGGGQMFTEAIMGTFGLKEPKAEKNKVTKGDLTPKAQARYPDATTEKLANAMLGPAGQLVSMIQSTVMICRAQTKISDLNIDRLVLTGGTARMRGAREYFQGNMSVPVEIFDPVGELDLSPLDAGDQAELGDDAYDFAVAVGLAETLLQPTAFALEVLTEKEKKKRDFLQRTVWALGSAAAALVLIVMLFNTEGAKIRTVQAANEQLDITQIQTSKIRERQEKAVAAETDARLKELALRIRRLPGSFSRAVMKALIESRAEFLYLTRFETETSKVSVDLAGSPTATRAETSEEVKPGSRRLHGQQIWPEVRVDGVVQKAYTENPGRTLNDYYSKLRGAIDAIEVEGWKVEMKETGLDRNNRFRIVFRPKQREGE